MVMMMMMMMRVFAMPMAIAITTLASVLTVALNMRHQDHHIILVVVIIIIIIIILVPSSFPQQQEQHQPKHQHLLMHMLLILTSLIHQRYHHCHLYRHPQKSWPQHHSTVIAFLFITSTALVIGWHMCLKQKGRGSRGNLGIQASCHQQLELCSSCRSSRSLTYIRLSQLLIFF